MIKYHYYRFGGLTLELPVFDMQDYNELNLGNLEAKRKDMTKYVSVTFNPSSKNKINTKNTLKVFANKYGPIFLGGLIATPTIAYAAYICDFNIALFTAAEYGFSTGVGIAIYNKLKKKHLNNRTKPKNGLNDLMDKHNEYNFKISKIVEQHTKITKLTEKKQELTERISRLELPLVSVDEKSKHQMLIELRNELNQIELQLNQMPSLEFVSYTIKYISDLNNSIIEEIALKREEYELMMKKDLNFFRRIPFLRRMCR